MQFLFLLITLFSTMANADLYEQQDLAYCDINQNKMLEFNTVIQDLYAIYHGNVIHNKNLYVRPSDLQINQDTTSSLSFRFNSDAGDNYSIGIIELSSGEYEVNLQQRNPNRIWLGTVLTTNLEKITPGRRPPDFSQNFSCYEVNNFIHKILDSVRAQ